jgi:hypothetical protein
VYVAGYYDGTLSFGGGALTLASNGLMDAYVVKLDASGTPLWAKSWGDVTEEDRVHGLGVDSTGALVVGGEFTGTVDFGLGPVTTLDGNDDAFLVKLSSAGVTSWVKTYGDNGSEELHGLAIGPSDTILITGEFDVIDFGVTSLDDVGSNDVFVAKLTSAGDEVWAKGFGSDEPDIGLGVALSATGDVYVIGEYQGPIDFGGGALAYDGSMGSTEDDLFLVKLAGATGGHLWSRGYGDNKDQLAGGIDVDSTGAVVVIGSFDGTVNFGGGALTATDADDTFVLKLSTTGAHVWSRKYGASSDQDGLGIALDAQDNLLLSGEFAGQIDFGCGSMASAGSDDVFVAKLPP